ncbi:hypothetical protein Mal4_48000 [Maioricimonas rarisocia]|uniref:Uncharacterized protein n=1 Tax=Maioricimonas rarisocia TaxID=2528026 RepID=A0A517ZD75_9PLAN|nr:hypothetical protein [Maioricimonas rarisocia]QDU40443.1 hypothetical protein Mal4_48000 [Maioricimonas rarisocia]
MQSTQQFQSRTEDHPPEGAGPVSPAERLLVLTEEVRAFVQVQLDRLEKAWTDCEGVLERERSLDERQRELERQQQHLESALDEQRRRLDDEYARLMDAWDRLESEKRQLLASGPVAAAAPAPPTQGETAVVPRMNGGPVPAAAVDILQPATAETPTTVPGRSETWSPEQSALQFQQLKREIGRHARRR